MKVIIVSGGFDPIHIGHLRMFEEAKKLGDKLIIILNNEHFLIQKKGYFFMPFMERKKILLGFKSVDRVVKCIDKDETVKETLKDLRKKNLFCKVCKKKTKNIKKPKVLKKFYWTNQSQVQIHG